MASRGHKSNRTSWDGISIDEQDEFVNEVIKASRNGGLPVIDGFCDGKPETTIYAKGLDYIRIRGGNGDLWPLDVWDAHNHREAYERKNPGKESEP